MSFVLVNADLSGCKAEDRAEIYTRLMNESWIKMHEDAADVNTTWLTASVPGVSEDEAMELTRKKFYSCCKPNCRPRVAFEWGYGEGNLVNLLA